MNDVVIQVEKLGKRYRIGQLDPYKTLREALLKTVSAPINAIASALQLQLSASAEAKSDNVIWAVRDISFEVRRGEVVGIIGRNGAGKTTLLKLLTRITTPTEGHIRIRGCVGALLEVTAGLGHPELTGRENIHLMGAILGMRRAEIYRNFNEIVEFSGVKKYLDTPMKRYSSGMRIRLVFSVAAHLEPDILLVDEVLAVGDVLFQQKCLGKMGDIAREGRTVLFVSHDMSAIQKLCDQSILLENGRIRNIGNTSDIINEYLAISLDISNIPLAERRNEQRTDARLIYNNIEFRNTKGQRLINLSSGEDTCIVLDYECTDNQQLKDVKLIYNIKRLGEKIVALDTEYFQNFKAIPVKGRIICNIPKLPVMPGYYSLEIRSYSQRIIVNEIREAATFYVKEGSFFESGRLPSASEARILVDHNWELEEG